MYKVGPRSESMKQHYSKLGGKQPQMNMRILTCCSRHLVSDLTAVRECFWFLMFDVIFSTVRRLNHQVTSRLLLPTTDKLFYFISLIISTNVDM